MKSVFICVLLLLAFISNSTGQQLIARQHGGTPTFYTDLNQAITEASGGDTLYLPGEAFYLNLHLQKELHFIGTGHHPDSSRVSGVTYISNPVYIGKGARKSSFEGLYFTHPIAVVDTSAVLLNFKRCNISTLTYSVGPLTVSDHHYTYCVFSENVFRDEVYANMANCRFNNCIFQSYQVNYWKNCVLKNNIFLHSSWVWWSDNSLITLSRFENNIFLTTYNFGPVTNSTFYNNMYVNATSFCDGVINIGSNELTAQSQESIFKNQSGNTFLYSHDYRLNDSSPGKNAGTDGTDIGIYGGPSPWKEGSVPFNPHIQAKTISGYTNADGTLNVQIKVKAQDR